MTGFKIPKTLAEKGFTGRSEFDWAPKESGGEAIWIGTIEKVRISEVPNAEGKGPTFVLSVGAKSAEVASIQIGSIEPTADGQANPGKQKYFDDLIMLSEDGVSFNSELPEKCNWRLNRAQGKLGNLAYALGLTDDVGDDVIPADNFEELFRTTDIDSNSGLAGQRVMFRVTRREFKKKDATDGVEFVLSGFLALP